MGLLYPTCNYELMKAADENGYLVRAIVIGEHVEIVLQVAFEERFQLGGVGCSACVISASRSIDCVCTRIIVDREVFRGEDKLATKYLPDQYVSRILTATKRIKMNET